MTSRIFGWALVLALLGGVLAGIAQEKPALAEVLRNLRWIILGLLAMAWESETLWKLAGIIVVIWFVSSQILWPLGEIQRIRDDLRGLRTDLWAVMDHLGLRDEAASKDDAPPA